MLDYNIIKALIKNKAHEFGFLEANIATTQIDITTQANFKNWLACGYAGEMDYLQRNLELRFNPQQLHSNTLSIISVKAAYLTSLTQEHQLRLTNKELAYISSYALGRDYHKTVKQQLTKYAAWINEELLTSYNLAHQYRVFTDSAPILEVDLAISSGAGWRGENTLLINRNYGSMFF